ncbi:IclR family transcriptional regulator [Asticcacaulis sp. 201]|uniref:IclR family transcriptional regulator n=1 Tax=Asticcacaulis sp. 201 TaxID=3028787 RepID=UPI00291713B7|nr:IclR family transcriptional regulator [Asticcacaulis sp. 201]MDV6332296.1 IclR family transcriptional regulator [Asticcacaulis sp. 201]
MASIENVSDESDEAVAKTLGGAQTLVRGLDVMMAIAAGAKTLPDLSEAIGLTRSTTHRLATTLVEQRFLNFTPRVGYSLGPRLLELGHLASRNMSLPRVAHDYLLQLSHDSGDTVHLGILEKDQALYLDKISGSRRIEISSRIGERQPLRSTGIGKALLLDETEEAWKEVYAREARQFPAYRVPEAEWLERMKAYSAAGYALDLEENEDRIRCVAAPIRDAAGRIIGSISVSSAAQYLDDTRMEILKRQVLDTVQAISSEFGWRERR